MNERNRTLAKRWFDEVWNRRRVETVDELMHPHAVGHLEGLETRGPEGFKAACKALLSAFPDLRIAVDDVIAESGHVVVRWTVSGTHAGDGLGMPGTGRPVRFRGMTWMRFSDDGAMVEGWDSWNQSALFQELRAALPVARGGVF